MPSLTPAQTASLRQHPHRLAQQFLYIFLPNTVFSSTVIGDIGRVQVIPYTLTGGTWADTRRGMTLWVGTTMGARDKGIIRIRGIDAGNLYVSEHEIDLVAGDHLTVLNEYRLWHIDPYIHTDGTIYKDWNGVAPGGAVAFPANVDDIYMPAPVMGPHSIIFLENGVATHSWDWRNSWTISPNSGALTYYAEFPDGTPFSTFATNGTVEWDATDLDVNNKCEKWVTLSLTDDMGGGLDVLAYTARRLYVTLDRDNLPDNVYVDFVPSPRMGSVDQGGFGMSFTVHVDAPEADFPDGALVMWFFDGGTQEDISGNWPGRSHIHFIGHIRKASTHKEPETGYVTFEATTLQGLMRALPMFPNFLEISAAPTIWTQAHSLTVQRAAYLHMRWMSSILEIADVIFVPDATTPIGEHEFPEGFLYDQLNALVNRDYMYRIGCDPLSTVYFNKDPQFQATHPGIATIMDIQAQDWRVEVDFPEPLEPQASYVIASGNAYAAGTVTPLFSEAPGPVPLQLGRKDRSLSRIICTTQIALNTLSGLALAQANNNFPDIPVKLDGQYYIGHLFPMEFVGLDIDSADTKRQMDLSSDLFIPRRSTLQVIYDSDGAISNALVDINVEKLTTGEGVDGQSLTYPTSTDDLDVPGPDEGPDGGDWEPPTPPTPTPSVCSALVAGHSTNGAYWSRTGGASWETRNTGLPSTALLDLIWDPWWFTTYRAGTSDPEHVILWACGLGFVARSGQDAGLSWTDVTPGTDPPNTWADATAPTASTVTYRQVHGDMHNLDTFYALVEWQEVNSGNDEWRGWIAKTVDDGVTWTWYDLATFIDEAAYTFEWDTADTEGWTPLADPFSANMTFWVDAASCGQNGYWRNDSPGGDDAVTWVYLQYSQGRMSFDAIAFDQYCFGGFNLGGTYRRVYTSPDGLDPWTLVVNTYIEHAGCHVHNHVVAVVDKYVRIATIGYGWFFHGGEEDIVKLNRVTFTNFEVGPDELRPLAMDLDTEDGTRIYITTWKDDVLYCQTHAAGDLSQTREYYVAAATEGQVAAKTYYVVPRQPHVLAAPDGDLVYVFGHWNDGADKHLAYSDDAGASFANVGDAAWVAAHRVGALDVLPDGTTLYAFINHAATPRLWESVDAAANWSNVNSIPFNVEFEAQYRCQTGGDEMVAGSNAAQAVMVARLHTPFTAAWIDSTATIPAAGSISAVIWV